MAAAPAGAVPAAAGGPGVRTAAASGASAGAVAAGPGAAPAGSGIPKNRRAAAGRRGARAPAAGSWEAASAERREAARWGAGWAAGGAGWRWGAAGSVPPPRTSPRPGTWRNAERTQAAAAAAGGARRLRGQVPPRRADEREHRARAPRWAAGSAA